MSPLQQQRLIGSILLACVICGIALFFMSNATDPIEVEAEVKPNVPAFSSVIEPLPSGDVEVQDEIVSEKQVKLTTDDPNNLAIEELALSQASVSPDKKIPEPVVVEPNPLVEKTAEKSKIEVIQPEKPVVKTDVISKPKPIPPVKIVPNKSATEINNKTQTPPKQEWLLQVASFSVKANAENIQVKIKNIGYQSNIESVTSASGIIYRVRIGPMNKVALQNISKNLKNKLGIDAQLMRKPN